MGNFEIFNLVGKCFSKVLTFEKHFPLFPFFSSTSSFLLQSPVCTTSRTPVVSSEEVEVLIMLVPGSLSFLGGSKGVMVGGTF